MTKSHKANLVETVYSSSVSSYVDLATWFLRIPANSLRSLRGDIVMHALIFYGDREGEEVNEALQTLS